VHPIDVPLEEDEEDKEWAGDEGEEEFDETKVKEVNDAIEKEVLSGDPGASFDLTAANIRFGRNAVGKEGNILPCF
jgi:hypothetical protein